MNIDDMIASESRLVASASPAALAGARDRLERAITAEEMHLAHTSAVRRRRRKRLALTSVTLAASLALIMAPTLPLGGQAPRDSASAAAVLVRAGDVAGLQPATSSDAPYWHVKAAYRISDGEVRLRESYLGRRGDGLTLDEGIGSRYLPAERSVFVAGDVGLSWDDLLALPTDPRVLEKQLLTSAGSDDRRRLFGMVGDLLRESPAPPRLRRALWHIAASLPDVSLLGPTRDARGRAGVAVEVRSSAGWHRYTLDPTTGDLLEEARGSDEPYPEGGGRDVYVMTILSRGPAASLPSY